MEANAQTRRFLNEQIRPLAEQARKVYAAGVALNAILPTLLEQLLASGSLSIVDGAVVAANPATVIDDGRAAEGVTQITTGDLALILNTIGGVVQTIAAEPGIQAALERASVRKLTQAD
jgi:hypothetical protein